MASGVALMAIRTLALSDRNIILTGYTGPNQPTIGRRIASKMQMRYLDIEREIEDRTGTSINDIRALYGESRLKTLEAGVVQEALLYRSAVIRISGQTLLHGNHYERLQETGPVICLVASLDAVLQSLHLALGGRYHNPNERALALGHLKREWAVRKLPDLYEIDTTYMPEDDVIEAVIGRWQQVVI
jgi:shikimate kinase